MPPIIQKYLPVMKWIAASLVTLAGSLLAAEHLGQFLLPAQVHAVAAYVVGIGAGLGIVSTGAKQPDAPPEAKS